MSEQLKDLTAGASVKVLKSGASVKVNGNAFEGILQKPYDGADLKLQGHWWVEAFGAGNGPGSNWSLISPKNIEVLSRPIRSAVASKQIQHSVLQTKYLSWHNPNNGVTYDTLNVLAVSGETQNKDKATRAILEDCLDVCRYFGDNGATVQLQASMANAKQTIKGFLQSAGNNKLLYYSGHGAKHGALVLGKQKYPHDSYLDWAEVREALLQSSFNGTLTIVLDSCYAGVWALRCNQDAADLGSEMNQRLPNLMVNFHLGCSPESWSHSGMWNGRFTYVWLRHLDAEDPSLVNTGHEQVNLDSHGFGNLFLRRGTLPHLDVDAKQRPVTCSFLFGPNRSKLAKDWRHCCGLAVESLDEMSEELKRQILKADRLFSKSRDEKKREEVLRCELNVKQRLKDQQKTFQEVLKNEREQRKQQAEMLEQRLKHEHKLEMKEELHHMRNQHKLGVERSLREQQREFQEVLKKSREQRSEQAAMHEQRLKEEHELDMKQRLEEQQQKIKEGFDMAKCEFDCWKEQHELFVKCRLEKQQTEFQEVLRKGKHQWSKQAAIQEQQLKAKHESDMKQRLEEQQQQLKEEFDLAKRAEDCRWKEQQRELEEVMRQEREQQSTQSSMLEQQVQDKHDTDMKQRSKELACNLM